MLYRFPVLIEKGTLNMAAWLPDLDGCVSTGATIDKTMTNIGQAIVMHLDGMINDGDPIPEPSTKIGFVVVEIDTQILLKETIAPLQDIHKQVLQLLLEERTLANTATELNISISEVSTLISEIVSSIQ